MRGDSVCEWQTLAEPVELHFLEYELPSSGRLVSWALRQDGEEIAVPAMGRYTITDDVLGCVRLARNGAGVAQAFRYVIEADLRSGALVELLPESGGCTRPIMLLYPSSRHVPLRVRSFVDYLVPNLGRRDAILGAHS